MTAKRTVYLEDIPMDEAIARLGEALAEVGRWQPLTGEQVALEHALGRVTAEPVWAAVSAPHYHASAMDGYAVRARDTEGATETSPLTLEVVEDDADAGAIFEFTLRAVGFDPMTVRTGQEALSMVWDLSQSE